jgi:hypothetical protein
MTFDDATASGRGVDGKVAHVTVVMIDELGDETRCRRADPQNAQRTAGRSCQSSCVRAIIVSRPLVSVVVRRGTQLLSYDLDCAVVTSVPDETQS